VKEFLEVLDLAVEFENHQNQVLGLAMAKSKDVDAVKSLIKDNPELADELEVKIRIKELAEA
jgi:recombination protein RecA